MSEKIERLYDYTVDTKKLLEEYLNISDKMDEVSNQGNAVLVQKRFHILFRGNLNYDGVKFLGQRDFPYTFEVSNQIRELFNFNSITYRSIEPNTAYNWHKDRSKISYHIPLISNPGCHFVYDSESYHMKVDDCIYKADTESLHTFVNAGHESRVHLTFEIL